MGRKQTVSLACSIAFSYFFFSCASVRQGENYAPYSIIPAARDDAQSRGILEAQQFRFFNESDQEAVYVLLTWEGYAGENPVSGEESLKIACDPGSSTIIELVPDASVYRSGDPIVVDTVRATRIRYSDGSVWADPFGRFVTEEF